MGVFGDTAYDLMGFTDPRKKLMSAIGAQGQPGPAPPPDKFQPTMAQGGTGPDQQNPPAPPPQPAVYTSAPDFSKMYLDMLNRQEGSDAIDRGMGMLFAGFAQPQDRAGMVNAMSQGSAKDPGTMITEMQTAQLNQGKIEARAQLLRDAPTIAKQLHMSIEQTVAAINSGAMDDIIKEQQKTTILQGSPLYHAQTDSAQTEADYHRAQAALEQAKTTLANATLPSDIAKAKGDVDKITAEIEKIKAETGAVPSLIQERTAAADKSAAETAALPHKTDLEDAQKKLADANALKAATTPQQQNYDRYTKDEIAAGRTPIGFLDFLKTGGGGSAREKMGLNLQWRIKMGDDGQPVKDENGNPMMEGFRIGDVRGGVPEVIPGALIKARPLDVGTGYEYHDPYTGAKIGDTIAKNVAEEAKQKAAGAETGKESAVASRAFESSADTLYKGYSIFDQLEKHKGLDGIVGAQSYLPIVRGTDRANAEALRTQAVSVLYNQAIQSLRGITSRAALQEISQSSNMQGRLDNTSQSADSYRQSIRDAKESIKRITAILADTAGKDRPDWVKDVDLNKQPGQKTGHWDKEKGKIVYD